MASLTATENFVFVEEKGILVDHTSNRIQLAMSERSGEQCVAKLFNLAKNGEEYQREMAGLQATDDFDIARVVEMHGNMEDGDGNAYVLTKLVQGSKLAGETLEHYTQASAFLASSQVEKETFVQTAAAQLLQTLIQLQEGPGKAHMRLCPSKILVKKTGDAVDLILFDFSASQPVSKSAGEKDAFPHAYFPEYAPPEVLYNKLRYHAGSSLEGQECMVNGSAVDVYSLGCILYRILTSMNRTFSYPEGRRDPPDNLIGGLARLVGQMQAKIFDGQMEWDAAVLKAEEAGQPIDHPVMTLTRAASATPDLAADFLAGMLHPIPELRTKLTDAYKHPYISKAVAALEAEQPAAAAAAAPLPLADVINIGHQPDKPFVKGQRLYYLSQTGGNMACTVHSVEDDGVSPPCYIVELDGSGFRKTVEADKLQAMQASYTTEVDEAHVENPSFAEASSNIAMLSATAKTPTAAPTMSTKGLAQAMQNASLSSSRAAPTGVIKISPRATPTGISSPLATTPSAPIASSATPRFTAMPHALAATASRGSDMFASAAGAKLHSHPLQSQCFHNDQYLTNSPRTSVGGLRFSIEALAGPTTGPVTSALQAKPVKSPSTVNLTASSAIATGLCEADDSNDDADSANVREVKAGSGKGNWWSKGLRCLKKHKTAILVGTATVVGAALAKRK